MQKIRAICTYSISFIFLVSIFFPVGASFQWKYLYDYRDFSDKINISSDVRFLEQKLSFETPRTSFSLVFPHFSPTSHDDVQVDWLVDGRTYTRHLDIDDMRDGYEEVVSTFPFVTEARRDISFRITILGRDIPSQVELVSSRQDIVGKNLVFVP
jgi:hypothetical protein